MSVIITGVKRWVWGKHGLRVTKFSPCCVNLGDGLLWPMWGKCLVANCPSWDKCWVENYRPFGVNGG